MANHSFHKFIGLFNPLPNDNVLDWSKMKSLADDKINGTENPEICFGKG